MTGKTLGLLGLGNIGAEVCRLVAPFGMEVVASDPFATPDLAASVGAKLVDPCSWILSWWTLCPLLVDPGWLTI